MEIMERSFVQSAVNSAYSDCSDASSAQSYTKCEFMSGDHGRKPLALLGGLHLAANTVMPVV